MPYRIRKSRSVFRPPSGLGASRVSVTSTVSSSRIGSGSRAKRPSSAISGRLPERHAGVDEALRTLREGREPAREAVLASVAQALAALGPG
mgnify:CR=1 FL=1